jgi:hypothetical protein
MILPNRSCSLIDWCETFSVAGNDDAPGSTLNAVTVNTFTVFYGGSVGLGLFKRDIKEQSA